jgi:hypothetical protein
MSARVAKTMTLNQPGRTGDENCAASNLAILDHLEDNGSSLPRLLLSNETLRGSSRF